MQPYPKTITKILTLYKDSMLISIARVLNSVKFTKFSVLCVFV